MQRFKIITPSPATSLIVHDEYRDRRVFAWDPFMLP